MKEPWTPDKMRFDYDELPTRVKFTSEGEAVSRDYCWGQCFVRYDENRKYTVECTTCGVVWTTEADSHDQAIRMWNQRRTEQRILWNFLNHVSKAFVKRTHNWVIVQSLLMEGTSTAGRTSSVTKCRWLGFDPYGYGLKMEDTQ